MTARFYRREIDWEAFRSQTDLMPPPGVAPPEAQYNIAPSQLCAILKTSQPGHNEGDYARHGAVMLLPAFWGLIPNWRRSTGFGEKPFSSFNARAENIAENAAFAGPFRHGRCLVPASGFYAWSGPEGSRTPFTIALTSRDWFCFAGLWSRAMIDGSEIDTFAIITCAANDTMAGFGASMPVILAVKDHRRWLEIGAHDPQTLLRPWPDADMRAWPANPAVGNVRNQGPEMIGDG
jgi:putative SOS response-associated peptidase YedK